MTRFLWLSLLGCSTTTTGTTGATTPGPAVAALSNTSIATARPLPAGSAFDLTLPCGVKAYFGPLAFTGENQRVALVSRVHTPTGKQVCGGGAFVDGSDVQQAGAGTGCVDGNQDHSANLEYVYAPAAGNSNATPIYLSLWTSNGTGDPAGPDCDLLALHLEVKAVP